jgi:hypothetical protein
MTDDQRHDAAIRAAWASMASAHNWGMKIPKPRSRSFVRVWVIHVHEPLIVPRGRVGRLDPPFPYRALVVRLNDI